MVPPWTSQLEGVHPAEHWLWEVIPTRGQGRVPWRIAICLVLFSLEDYKLYKGVEFLIYLSTLS